MKFTFRLIMSILGLTVALSANAQIYQWKDKDGKMHFSDRLPQNQPGIQVQTLERPQQSATEAEQASDAPEAEADNVEPAAATIPAQSQAEQFSEGARKRRAAAEAKEKAEKDADRAAQGCQRARTQYAALNSGRRISLPTEDGGRRLLNDEERAAEIARTRDLIDGFCGKD
ncbi:MAG: DUF4124 domain-containing protein [Betaproteobacteria bacterium]|nr:DUF4124 domain-containing protein [Betaproteobacteria bacterium]